MVVEEQRRRSPAGEEMVCAIWTCIIGRLLRLLIINRLEFSSNSSTSLGNAI